MSAAEQLRLLARGEVTGEELRDEAIAVAAQVDPHVHALVTDLFDGCPAGVPIVVKDAGQQLAGVPHYVGVEALRDAGHRSTTTTRFVALLQRSGFSVIGTSACPALASGITTEPPG